MKENRLNSANFFRNKLSKLTSVRASFSQGLTFDLEKNKITGFFQLLPMAAHLRSKLPCEDDLAFSAIALSIFQWIVHDFYFSPETYG